MKRKLFTLLMAFMALAAFQANAQQYATSSGSVWINADTTGLNQSRPGENTQDPYYVNKVYQDNWLDFTNAFVIKSGQKEGAENLSNRLQMDVIGNVLTQFIISAPNVDGKPTLNLSYSSVPYNSYEVVQFWIQEDGGSVQHLNGKDPELALRMPQALASDGVIEGWLTPAHMAKPNFSSVEANFMDQLFVVTDTLGNLSIKKLSDFAEYVGEIAAKPAVYPFVFKLFDDPKSVPFQKTGGVQGQVGTESMFIMSAAWMSANYNATTEEWSGDDANGTPGSWVMDDWADIQAVWDGHFYVNPTGQAMAPALFFECQFYYLDTTTGEFVKITTNTSDFVLRIEGGPTAGNFEERGGSKIYYIEENLVKDTDDAVKGAIIGGIDTSLTPIEEAEERIPGYLRWKTGKLGDVNFTNPVTGKRLYTPIYIRTEPIGGRWLRSEDLGSGLLYCKGGEGSPLNYIAFSSDRGYLTGTIDDRTRSTFQISFAGNQPLFETKTGIAYKGPRCDEDATAKRTAKYDKVGNVDSFASYGIDFFTLRSPEEDCKYLTVSKKNAISMQVGASLTAFGDLFDLQTKIDGANAGLQEYAIWINSKGEYELYPLAAYKVDHGNNAQNPVVGLNMAVLENRHPGRIYYKTGGCSDEDKTIIEDENYYRIGFFTANGIQGTPAISIVPNQLQNNTAFEFLPFKNECRTFVNEIPDGKWNFLVVNNWRTYLEEYIEWLIPLNDPAQPLSHNNNKACREAREAFRTEYNNIKNFNGDSRRWVLSTTVDAAGKHLIVVPEEVLIGKTGDGDDEAEYWKNPHDSVNMAAHWAIAKAADMGYKTEGGYIIYNMLGDVIAYDESGDGIKLVGGYRNDYLTNNAIIPTKINGTNLPLTWYASNTTIPDADARFIWNSISFEKGSPNFYLALQDVQPNKSDPKTGLNVFAIMERFGIPYKTTFHQKTHDDCVRVDVGLEYTEEGLEACAGLMLSIAEIPYVPKFASSYPEEGDNGKINTTDPSYKDGTMFKDSLTAYLHLRGNFDFHEATYQTKTGVENQLVWTYKTVNIGNGGTVDQALLGVTDKQKNLEIIPLGTQKTDLLKVITAPSIGLPADVRDYLYEENYKWFLVKDDQGRYLVYDTVNVQAGNNRSKVGLTFKNVDIRNATPVRFYQPLVGDKQKGNFIIQFYSAVNKYHNLNETDENKPTDWHGHATLWPDIEGAPGTSETGGKLLFARIDAQTNYIFATKNAYDATRFNYGYTDGPTCCLDQYVEPQWMADNHVLGVPVANRAFSKGVLLKDYGMAQAEGDFGYLTKQPTDITHNLIGYIYQGKFYHKDWKNDKNEANAIGAYKQAHWGGKIVEPFAKDLPVPVYTIQNLDGKYLTVAPASDQLQTGSTVQDVTGTKLNWADKIENKWDTAYYYAATQFFAIADLCEESDLDDITPMNYQRFAYFPLASYKIDYKTGTVVTTKIDNKDVQILQYNNTLGTKTTCNRDEEGADLTNAFRIGQYSVVGSDNPYSMIVVGATANSTSNIPVEFAWGSNNYDKPECVYNLVYSAKEKAYFTNDGTVSQIKTDSTFTTAHWAVRNPDTNDEYLTVFKPEIEKMYDAAIKHEKLTSQYYLKQISKEGDPFKAITYDLKSPISGNYYFMNIDTLTFTCVNHDLPYYDLEADGGYNLDLSKLAAFEAIYLDRNIFTEFVTKNEVPDKVNQPAYQALVKNIVYTDTENAIYLKVYKSIRRELTPLIDGEESHVIPYYNFSLTKVDNKGNETEYFLNVKPGPVAENGLTEKDSVRFTYLTTAEKDVLFDYDGIVNAADKNAFANYKFCLPIAVNGIERVDTEKVDQPLYIMSYDTKGGNANSPYLLIIGAGSDMVTARQVARAYDQATINSKYDWSIYTMDYSFVASDLVTVWTFSLNSPDDNEWVLLRQPVTDGEGTGVLANADIPGYTQYLGPVNTQDKPNAEPVNYAKIVTESGESELLFIFEGDTVIGDYAKRPIWYYRIQDPLSGDYLTDAVDSTDAPYWYGWNKTSSPYAFFGELIDDNADYVKEGINADKKFQQTFGLRYVDATIDADKGIFQKFVVVSQADYTEPFYPSKNYRYLANVQGRFVFVDNREDAMVFSWGGDVDNKWVSIQGVNGTFAVIGAKGAIQVNNAQGVVDIYTIDGRKVSSTTVTSANQTIPTPAGVVIVKNGAKVAKVVVK